MIDGNEFRRLVLADDTVLDDCECGYSEGAIGCFLYNISMAEAFQLFSDPEKIKTIRFEYGIEDYYMKIMYTGCNELIGIDKKELYIAVTITGPQITIEKERIRPERVGDE